MQSRMFRLGNGRLREGETGKLTNAVRCAASNASFLIWRSAGWQGESGALAKQTARDAIAKNEKIHCRGAKLRALQELVSRKVGHVILVNLDRAFFERMLSKSLAKDFIDRIDRKIGSWTSCTDAEFLYEVRHAVWDDAARFQLQGPVCTTSQDQLVVLKSYSDIKGLAPDVSDTDLRRDLKSLTSKPYENATDSECQEIARVLTDLNSADLDLHLGRMTNAGGRLIVWSTRLAELRGLGAGSRPDNSVANRIRDQLGLGHFRRGYPIFAFISRYRYAELLSKASCQPRRPIVYDAIDQAWFKHKRDKDYVDDNWGRSADLEKVALGTGPELDGGPEAVSESFSVAGHFQCVFVGRAIANAPDPNIDVIQRFSDETDAEAISRKIEAVIG